MIDGEVLPKYIYFPILNILLSKQNGMMQMQTSAKSVKHITETMMSILITKSLCRSSNVSVKYAAFKWPMEYPLVAL